MVSVRGLGYTLHHLSFVVDRQSDIILQELLGIGFSQFKILMVLQQQPRLRQIKVAECLGQTEASISRQIKLLNQQGLLKTITPSQNKRERITQLTLKGQQIADKAIEVLEQHHKPMFDMLSEKQQTILQELLNLMHEECCKKYRPGACSKEYK